MHARAWRGARAGLVTAVALALLALSPGSASGHPAAGDDARGITDNPVTDQDLRERYEAVRHEQATLRQSEDGAATAEAALSTARHRRDRDRDLRLLGRGERLVEQATTDVWAHRGFGYIGTFNVPCGTGENFVEGVGRVDLVDDVEEPGIAIFSVFNPRRPRHVGNLPSVEGSRTNDVKVDRLGRRDILVHSNEACADGGPGGIEIYDVTKPRRPVHQSSIRIDELNPITDELFGGVTDVGVHNMFLFEQGRRSFVSVVSEGVFDNFMTFDITDPTSPELVSAWGAEELFDPGVGDETEDVDRVLAASNWLLDGFGTSRNRFLHDITYDLKGRTAYLSNWDAGLVRMDMSDPANPQVVSVALDEEDGSLDGEVNSHAAWPSEDGRIVVETEEDFDHVRLATAVTDGPLAGEEFGSFEDTAGPPPPRLADVGVIEAEAVWVGQLCEGDPVENAADFDAGDIAVIRRGTCAFSDKLVNAQDLGASAALIANNLPGQPGLANGSFGGLGDIPGLFISTDAGDQFEANQTSNTVVLDPDEITLDPWGGVRIWDYSDPANPVLASTFDTLCSADTTGDPSCDPDGTYSVHNVIVESQGRRTLAYISWYWDGMLVLDVTDPENPTEVARFFDDSPEFIEENGGNPHDFWGVYKIRNRPVVYGADRNGGLSTFLLR